MANTGSDTGAPGTRQGRRPPAPGPALAAAGPAADAVDARVRRSRERVLRATSELLGEGGVGGVNVDEVARRSGVARTTIYRHWPTRADLVVDACSQLGAGEDAPGDDVPGADAPGLGAPDTGSLEGDLTALLTTLAALLRTARWSAVVPSIVDAAERDPALAAVHGRIQQGHAAPFRAALARAVGRGELPADTDPSVLTAGLLGPLFYRRWFSREALDPPFVHGVVRHALRACGVPPATA